MVDPQTRATIGLVFFLLVGLIVLWAASEIFLLAALGILVAVFLRSLGNPLASFTGLKPATGLWIVVFVIVLTAALTGWLFSDTVASQVKELSARLPEAVERMRETLGNGQFGHLFGRIGTDISELFQRKDLVSRAAGVLSSTVGFFSSALVVLVGGLFLASDPDLYKRGFVRLFRPERRTRMQSLLEDLYDTARWWLLGKSFTMMVIGIATAVGLHVLEIPLAFLLAILAAVLAFIPYIGPILAAIPAVTLGFVEGPSQAASVALLYAAIQLVESNLLAPLVAKKTVSLPPALTIFAQLLAGFFFGFLGVLLASPVAAVTIVLVKRLYVEDRLESSAT